MPKAKFAPQRGVADTVGSAEAPTQDPVAGLPAATGDDAYLNALGQRVRRIRALRGMSRKVLAQVSGISERYIAQLEGGQGNLSIILLRRIAQATGVPVEDIVSDADEASAALRDQLRHATPERLAEIRKLLQGGQPATVTRELRRVALIGLRGAGKSTLGQLAAEKLGIDFVELNRDIETDRGFSVTEIFKLYGQEGYRRMEFAALKRIASRNQPMIVATGGGVVAETSSFEYLLKNFYTIWVKALPEEHMQRVRKQGDLRPMANNRAAMKELVTILESRAPLYGRADAIIDTSRKSVEESVDDLLACMRAASEAANSAVAP